MYVDHDAKVKFFLVMPYMPGMSDIDGGQPEFEFPSMDYCECYFFRDAAEEALLKKQKADPEATYIILENILFAARHDRVNEYCVMDTVQW